MNKAIASDTDAFFYNLHLSVYNGFVSSNNHVRHDGFDFAKVNYLFFLGGDAPRRTSYDVYISKRIRFTRLYSHMEDVMLVINV